MALTNEDLLAISQLLDTKLKPLEDQAKNIELLLENDTLPRLQNIESCYTSTSARYCPLSRYMYVRSQRTHQFPGEPCDYVMAEFNIK